MEKVEILSDFLSLIFTAYVCHWSPSLPEPGIKALGNKELPVVGED